MSAMIRGFISVFAISIFISNGSAGAPPATQGAAPVWEIYDTVHGTAAQIRDQVNGEVEQQVTRRNELLARIAKLDPASVKKPAIDPKREALRKDLVATEEELEQIRSRTDNFSERLEASKRQLAAKRALDDYDKAVVQQVNAAEAANPALAEAHKDLSAADQAIRNARAVRSEIIQHIEVTYALVAPLDKGRAGLLGVVYPSRVIDKKTCIATYVVSSRGALNVNEAPQGQMQVQLVGLDTDGLRMGCLTEVWQQYAVAGEKDIPGVGRVTVMERRAADVDKLMEAVCDLHVYIEPRDISKLTFADPNTRDFHPTAHWESQTAALKELLPAGFPHSQAAHWTAKEVDSVNSQLGHNFHFYDVMDLTVVITSVRAPMGRETFEIRAKAPPGDKAAAILLNVPNLFRAKVAALPAGRPVHVSGVLNQISVQPDGTLNIELDDVGL